MDRVLAGLQWETCLFYLDDIIVFAATWEEHLARLRQIFKRLRQAQLKLGAEKCTLAAKKVSYLGHWVTSEGLLPDPTLLAAIQEIGPPRLQQKFANFWASPGTTGDMSPPSWTSTSRSGCTPMPPLQASELSSLKYEKERSASFPVPHAPLTRQRKHTPPLNWSASPSSGPLPNSVPT